MHEILRHPHAHPIHSTRTGDSGGLTGCRHVDLWPDPSSGNRTAPASGSVCPAALDAGGIQSLRWQYRSARQARRGGAPGAGRPRRRFSRWQRQGAGEHTASRTVAPRGTALCRLRCPRLGHLTRALACPGNPTNPAGRKRSLRHAGAAKRCASARSIAAQSFEPGAACRNPQPRTPRCRALRTDPAIGSRSGGRFFPRLDPHLDGDRRGRRRRQAWRVLATCRGARR